jgi:hypothetical protein
LITFGITSRVFRIAVDGKSGSSYTVECEKSESQFLVSAHHIFEGCLDVNSINIFQDNVWKKINVEIVYASKGLDTIVFRLPFDISRRSNIIVSENNIPLASTCYFLGFPFGLFNDGSIHSNGFPLPFIKSAIISGMMAHGSGTVIYLDGHNNKGFSGGPVIAYPNGLEKEPQIIGTVSGYINEPTVDNNANEMELSHANAGIVKCFGLSDILDKVDKIA